MKRSTALFATAQFLGLLSMPACSRKAEVEGTDWIAPAARELNSGLSLGEAAGYRTFRHYCAICHGNLGAGDGFNSFNLNPKPRDLKEVFQKEGKQLVGKTIREGTAALGRSPQCPPWGLTLNAYAIDDIVLFIGAIDRVKSPEPAAPQTQGPAESR